MPITSKIQRSGPAIKPIAKPSTHKTKMIIPTNKSTPSILTSFYFADIPLVHQSELSIKQLRRQCHQQPLPSLKSAEASTTTLVSPGLSIGPTFPEHPFFFPPLYYLVFKGQSNQRHLLNSPISPVIWYHRRHFHPLKCAIRANMPMTMR
jgi:hypothetical protein